MHMRGSDYDARRRRAEGGEMDLRKIRKPYITIDATIESEVGRQRCYGLVVSIGNHKLQLDLGSALRMDGEMHSEAAVSFKVIA